MPAPHQPSPPPPKPRYSRTIATAILGGILGAILGNLAGAFAASHLPREFEGTQSLDCKPAHRLLAEKPKNQTGLTPDDLDPAGYPASEKLAATAAELGAKNAHWFGAKPYSRQFSNVTFSVSKGTPDGTVLRVTLKGSDSGALAALLTTYRDAYEEHLLTAHFEPLISRADAIAETLKSTRDDGFESLGKLTETWKTYVSIPIPGSVSAALGDLGKMRQDNEEDTFFFAAHLDTLDNKQIAKLYNHYDGEPASASPPLPREMAFRIALWRATLDRIQQLHDTVIFGFRSALDHSSGPAPEVAKSLRDLIDQTDKESAPRRSALAESPPEDLLSALNATDDIPAMIDQNSRDTWTHGPHIAKSTGALVTSISRIGGFGGFGIGFLLSWLASRRFQARFPQRPDQAKPDAEWQ